MGQILPEASEVKSLALVGTTFLFPNGRKTNSWVGREWLLVGVVV